jgi:hypothetical protein
MVTFGYMAKLKHKAPKETRVAIYFPDDVDRAVEIRAAELNQTKKEFVVNAVRSALAKGAGK